MSKPKFNLTPLRIPDRARLRTGPMVSVRYPHFGCAFNTAAFELIGLRDKPYCNLFVDADQQALVFAFHNDPERPDSILMSRPKKNKTCNGKSYIIWCKELPAGSSWLQKLHQSFESSQRFELKHDEGDVWYAILTPPKQARFPGMVPVKRVDATSKTDFNIDGLTDSERIRLIAQLKKGSR